MLFVFFSSLFFGLSNSQNPTNCVYRFGGLELDLLTLKGTELNYKGNGAVYHYSVCEDSLQCTHNSVTTSAMIDAHPDGIEECFYLAQMNETLLPFYDFAIGSWIFNFSNGEACPDRAQQLNRSIQVMWSCNVDYNYARITDVYHYDECNDLMTIEWEGACNPPPPPNQKCEFRSGFQSLNLSTIQGIKYQLLDQYNNSWQFTPCSNGLKCLSNRGSTLDVMAEVADPTGQCIKYLGVWSGDSIPFYDRTVFGQDYWDFFWMNGEECGEGGPAEVLNVRYYCNATVNGAVLREAKGAGGPCAFRYEFDTSLACNAQENKQKKMKKHFNDNFKKIKKDKKKNKKVMKDNRKDPFFHPKHRAKKFEDGLIYNKKDRRY